MWKAAEYIMKLYSFPRSEMKKQQVRLDNVPGCEGVKQHVLKGQRWREGIMGYASGLLISSQPLSIMLYVMGSFEALKPN
jgi:hypothetical protein